MKILFLTRHYGYLRNYESTISRFLALGHTVHIAADREEMLGGREMVERWAHEHTGLTMGWTPDREADHWLWIATRLRLAQDFLRYQDPNYDSAPQLRLRAEERIPTTVLALLNLLGYRTKPIRLAMEFVLNLLERAAPLSKALCEYFSEQKPDVVLITPLVELGSPQLDHLRAARKLGLRTALCVGSWDHLSSKSRIRDCPDRIFVWNETQKRELLDWHGVPVDRVVVTGAQCFDQWFDREPSQSREAFCESLCFRSEQPIVTWVCSSLFRGSPPEADLVEEWIRQLRASGKGVLSEANILIRPHPQRQEEWRRVEIGDYDHVAIRGGYPNDEGAKDAYFDALYHSGAVVGLNTSSLIEAGIVGRPVLSIVTPAYASNQQGTVHWSYLLDVGGGLVRAAQNLSAHCAQLQETLSGRTIDNEPFIKMFVRPYGLKVAGTPLLVEAVEALGKSASSGSVGPGVVASLLRPLLYPLIWLRVFRGEWRVARKKSRRNVKRWVQQTKRGVRQSLKRLILKRARSEQPVVVLPKSERIRNRAQNLFDSVEEVEDTKEALTRMARSGKPIIVGPWLSETGFELLYWIPFLNWAKQYGNFRDDRLIAISRGGCANWYRHMTSTYHDVFDFYTPEEFRDRNEQRIVEQGGLQKHVGVAEFDQEIIGHVQNLVGTRDVEVLHPSLMYKLFRIFWRLQASVGLVQGFTVHRNIEISGFDDLELALPSQYIAVKFYTNNSFPDTPSNRSFITSYLNQLTLHHDVVLLSTGFNFDDHLDFQPERRERLHTVEHLMSPRNNLDIQTHVIARSKAFVGTYGGFSYLAPLLGVDAVAFFSDGAGFRIDHLEIAKRVFTDLHSASFLALDVRDLDVLRIGLGMTENVASEGG
tara:strand:- start:6097 stop:8724 length:2628 start_codon:yes stop_codon:yes gene_type:complete